MTAMATAGFMQQSNSTTGILDQYIVADRGVPVILGR
jgi:hypothetical protein